VCFISPMLCATLRDPSRLGDPRYVAEPKLDGQRAQLHVAEGRTEAAFSRPGHSLLASPGLAWLREVAWPIRQAALDGELCAATGQEGILGVFEARKQSAAPLAFLAFDLLAIEGREILREPWSDRRKRLEDLGAGFPSSRIALVPVTEDATALWATWVGWGGEGIVLKDRRAPYRPGARSPEWLKLKQRHTLAVRVDAADPRPVRWGDWGWAVNLTLTYRHPSTRQRFRIDEVVRVSSEDAFTLRRGERGVLECWGFLSNGRLRHPVWLGWGSEVQRRR
jgi:bifunctional non-homologous end joining protein LigD